MNDIVIKSIRVKASYDYQSVEVEAEFPNGTSPELTEAVQKRALELAIRQAELGNAHKNNINLERQKSNNNYQSSKRQNNQFLRGGNR